MPLGIEDYVVHIRTKEDYMKMYKSGMAWEVFPFFPAQEQHEQLVKTYFEKRGILPDILDCVHPDCHEGITPQEAIRMLKEKSVDMGDWLE